MFAVRFLPLTLTAHFGILLASATLAACSAQPSKSTNAAPEILRWVHPEADIVSVLSEEPRECLSAQANYQETLGRLAFRSPFLLGGQAARRGLTCQACHSQGQTNTNFFVVGLSDTPGTADVTSFHFSDELGDEVFNPVPIPSLSDDIESVSFDDTTDALDTFVHRLITKEFTGPEPVPFVEAALLSYIRALDDTECSTPTLEGAELFDFNIRIISESFDAIAMENQSVESHDFMIAALRIDLGRLHDRLPNHPNLQASLVSMSQKLNTFRHEQSQFDAAALEWRDIQNPLSQAYEASLFNPSAISKWQAER